MEAHPDLRIGYRFILLKQIKNNKLNSNVIILKDKGKTTQRNNEIDKFKIGIKKKIFLFLNRGIVICLEISFIASAKGCIKPKNPTLFGPIRIWIFPRIFCSIKVVKATASSNIIIRRVKDKIFTRRSIFN